MTTTISRLYNSQMEARTAVRDLEAAGLKNGDISIVASNADNWYDAKTKTFMIWMAKTIELRERLPAAALVQRPVEQPAFLPA